MPQPDNLSTVLDYTDQRINEQNRLYVFRALAENPLAGSLLFDWLERNLPSLEKAHPYLRSVAVAAVIPACVVDDESRLDELLDDYECPDPSLAGVISMAREKREVYRRLRRI